MRQTARLVAMVLCAALLVLVGSVLYWRAEGSPGSPADFRAKVATSGLLVDWRNNGPSGGDGIVETECGRRFVTFNEIEGELWVRWDDTSTPLTDEIVPDVLAC